jgi:hypothetical protein
VPTPQGAPEFTSPLPTFLLGSRALANVRFGADSGLKSDIASCPKSAKTSALFSLLDFIGKAVKDVRTAMHNCFTQ